MLVGIEKILAFIVLFLVLILQQGFCDMYITLWRIRPEIVLPMNLIIEMGFGCILLHFLFKDKRKIKNVLISIVLANLASFILYLFSLYPVESLLFDMVLLLVEIPVILLEGLIIYCFVKFIAKTPISFKKALVVSLILNLLSLSAGYVAKDLIVEELKPRYHPKPFIKPKPNIDIGCLYPGKLFVGNFFESGGGNMNATNVTIEIIKVEGGVCKPEIYHISRLNVKEVIVGFINCTCNATPCRVRLKFISDQLEKTFDTICAPTKEL